VALPSEQEVEILAESRKLQTTSTPGIYRRGGGYAVRFRDPHGKVRQRAARTLAEARRLRAELAADVGRGEYRPDTKITFAAYATTWTEGYGGRTGRGIREETLREYRRDLQIATRKFGAMRLSLLGPADLKAYAREMAAEGLRPATVRRRLAPVKAMLATAVEEGVLRLNPAAGLRIGAPVAHEEHEEPAKVLSVEQLERLVAAVPGGGRRLMVELLAQTGIRHSECLGLRWRDLDLPGRRLHVRQRIRAGRAGAPKSEKGRREIPIGRELARALVEHRLASRWSSAGDLVFAADDGGPVAARGTYRWFKPAAERAGVGWAAFHVLRHTAATRWLLSGVSIAQVSRLLGHHDAGFTLRTYISVLPADLPDGDLLARAVGLGASASV
jgi:integrase